MSGSTTMIEGVTPNLMYEDAHEAVDWLVKVLGFEERARYVDQQDVVRQAELFAGRSEIWLSGQGAGYWSERTRGPEQYLVIWVSDVDAQYERVISAGIEASSPVNQTWGVRNFYVTDPGGYHWGFHSRLPSGYQQVKPTEQGGLREILKQSEPSV